MQDLIFAMRGLRRKPLFAAIVISTLAIAIAANVSVFGVLRGILLSPLPYPDSERLVALSTVTPSGTKFSWSLPALLDVGAQSTTLTQIAGLAKKIGTLTGHGPPRSLRGVQATSALFELVGARPELGRFFNDVDVRANNAVAVVSDSLWRTSLSADPKIIGKPISIDAISYTVVGVAPPNFVQPDTVSGNYQADFWTVLGRPGANPDYRRGRHFLQAYARLRTGAMLESTNAELAAIFNRLGRTYDADARWTARATSLTEAIVGPVRPLMIIAMAAVIAVLLVACANVANLLLTRGATRTGELAVRVAVGASGAQVISQLLTETVLLIALGGIAGTGLAMVAVRSFVELNPPGFPRLSDVRFDGAIAIYTFGVVALCVLVSGLGPALTVSRQSVAEVLKAGFQGADVRRGGRMRGWFVSLEIAMTFAVLVASGLLIRSFLSLTQVPLGFTSDDVVVIPPSSLPGRRYAADRAIIMFQDQVIRRVTAIPGVVDAAWTTHPPFSSSDYVLAFEIVGRPTAGGEFLAANLAAVGNSYFKTLHIPLLRGRTFDATDRQGSQPSIIVNEAFAHHYFAHGSPLGKRVILSFSNAKPLMRTVVGIVGDARDTYAVAAQPRMYVPLAQMPDPSAFLAVRTQPNAKISRNLGSAIPAVDALLAAPVPFKMAELLARDASRARLFAIGLGTLAGIALFLSLAGIYAIVSYGVLQRTHEFGIRMAVGASTSHILLDVVGRAVRTIGTGFVLGLILSAVTSQALSDQLYGVSTLDPFTYLSVAIVLAAAAIIASIVPAIGATKTDPVTAIRYG